MHFLLFFNITIISNIYLFFVDILFEKNQIFKICGIFQSGTKTRKIMVCARLIEREISIVHDESKKSVSRAFEEV